jgi:hypothetical protein
MMRAIAVPIISGLLALSAAAQVKITSGAEKIAVEIHGQPYTTFYIAGKDVTKPYLHPLRAPSGTYVTRMWPMENVAEEAPIAKPDHPHQRGLWIAHDSVNKTDFWNNEASYQEGGSRGHIGNIVLKKVDGVKSGKDKGSIAATFEWTPRSAQKPLLTESRLMTFYDDAKARIIDFDVTFTALDEKVTFGDGKDGFFGVRMRPVLYEKKPDGVPKDVEYKTTGKLSNADGLVGEKELWSKPSNWCDYSGDVNGEKVGIAILDNPENPHHPVRWHARGYGLFAANPFGLAAFTNDKSLDGSITIEPGQKLRFRYRTIVHAGDVKEAAIAAAWEQYAKMK